MKNRLLPSLLAAAVCAAPLALLPRADAHCQVPCGIFDDNGVIAMMHTDYETIAKASKLIPELLKEDPIANANQVGRWIANKESHAQSIQDTVAKYFLAQRVKLAEASSDKESYLKKLALCHEVIVAAMKCKQTTDPAAVKTLHDLLHRFEKTFGEKKKG